ncbi:TetR family transcriptional regulator [Lentzea sp. CA-135723]|uniref:TetR family transcriptional regulator n=1 Tax=Lentzea sp. CA-135723 TaxID=3239950 RepID=UPI003D8D7E02
MRQRARSAEDKAQRSEALLDAAQELALELGGVRYLTVAAVTDRAGLHRTGVRRYYASKEELLLAVAERGWSQWRAALSARLEGEKRLRAGDVADVLAETITSLPVFVDLLGHVPVTLEGSVDTERSGQYKTTAFTEHDKIIEMLERASVVPTDQLHAMIAAALPLASAFWQAAHPTPALAKLYEQQPSWGHMAMEFEPRLKVLLQAIAVGLSEMDRKERRARARAQSEAAHEQ